MWQLFIEPLTCQPKYGSLPPNLNNNLMTAVIGWSRQGATLPLIIVKYQTWFDLPISFEDNIRSIKRFKYLYFWKIVISEIGYFE